jgi:pimeloyl-ACP methyl ester carboxylesterase
MRPGAAQLLRAWAAEVIAAPQVFLWRQPFRWRSEPDHLPPVARGRRGVVLVHGFFCNRGLWNPWLRRLRSDGIPFAAVNLEPVFGSIDGYGQAIDDAARRLAQATGLAPMIVAHSMGGLAVRAWLSAVPDAPWHRLVTIASPHAGTRLGAHGRGVNIAQMRLGSDWLVRLGARETADFRRRLVCFWGHCDNIVFPTRSATLAGADNRHLAVTPHVQMVYHPAVLEELLRALETDA